MTLKKLLITASLVVTPAILLAQGQGLDPAKILKPLSDEWLTYSGDSSGKRYSLLKQINQQTVKNLTLAWTLRLTAGSMNGSGGDVFGGGRGGASPNFIIGGEGTGDYPAGGPPTIKASALMVDGTLYVTAPDNANTLDIKTSSHSPAAAQAMAQATAESYLKVRADTVLQNVKNARDPLEAKLARLTIKVDTTGVWRVT